MAARKGDGYGVEVDWFPGMLRMEDHPTRRGWRTQVKKVDVRVERSGAVRRYRVVNGRVVACVGYGN